MYDCLPELDHEGVRAIMAIIIAELQARRSDGSSSLVMCGEGIVVLDNKMAGRLTD